MKNWIFYTCLACLFIFHAEGFEQWAPSIEQIDHPVSTTNSEAQKYFNAGLTQVFAFNHDLAFFQFEKAAQEDPNLAMAYWGMALSLGQNINSDITPENEKKAFVYSRKALSLLSRASPVEHDYIEALAVRYTDDPERDLIVLRNKYCDAMEKLVAKYPQDLDATCLFVESILDLNPWRYWTWDGKPKARTLEAIDILQSVLNRDPNHMAANHFYIHSWEESPTPERALLSAFRLTTLFPYGGHLLHMPCHIFILCGFYENAVATSKRAIAVDRKYIQEYGMDGPYPLHYLTHNLKVLSRAYMLWGNEEEAMKTALELKDFVEPYYRKNDHLAKNLLIPLEVNLFFQRWNNILEAPLPETSDPYVNSYFRFARAFAFLHLGDKESYQKERDLMVDFANKISPHDEVANTPPKKIIDLAALLLDAEEVKADRPAYIAKLEQAVDLQDRFDYDEPPPWYLPLRLELGQALLEDKQYSEAEKVLIKGLQEYKRNGFFLTALYKALKGQNREWDAFWVEREAKNANLNPNPNPNLNLNPIEKKM